MIKLMLMIVLEDVKEYQKNRKDFAEKGKI